MSFGDQDACVGWLIGPEQGGMPAMFTMMNHARINIGLQGVALADFTMISGFDCDITQAIPNGAEVEIDPNAERPYIRLTGS